MNNDTLTPAKQLEELAVQAGVTPERMEEFMRTMQEFEAHGPDRTVTYTNRAARRARARAEKRTR
jgi:hypothetical protein